MITPRDNRFGIALTVIITATLWSDVGAAGPFSQLIVFGDSLSDVGNIASVTSDTFPGPYYHNDRFSNGSVYVEALSVGLGLGPTVRSTAGGNNFAYGGAQTSGTGGFTGLFIRDIDEQIDQYLATRTVDPNALFLVFAGSNDLVNGQTNISVPINNLAEDIGRLALAGARKVLVPNLPPLGHTPRFNGNPNTLAEYNTRSSQFNSALDTMLDNFETSNTGVTFFRFDVAALFSEALAGPAAFGLIDVINAAAPGLEPGAGSYNTSQIAANANEYMFWDELHPTATIHAVLAERILEHLTPRGDYNSNGVIDAADYVVWRNTLGDSGPGLAADGNGDGGINDVDYDVWRAHFGNTAKLGGAASAHLAGNPAVPEPAPCSLLAPVLVLGFRLRAYNRVRS